MHRCFAPGIVKADAGGEFDFSTLGLTSDLDGRAGITTTGSGVSDWQDQGTANLDATQGTDADRPADGGSVGGANAIDFDVSNTERLDWALATADAGTILVVGQVGSAPATNSDSVLGSGATGVTDAGVQLRHHTDTTMDVRLSNGTTRISAGTVTLGAGVEFIVGIRWSSGTIGIKINDNAEQTNSYTGSPGTGAFKIGSSTPGTSYWDGEITRILAAPTTDIGATDLATAITELNGIYSVY